MGTANLIRNFDETPNPTIYIVSYWDGVLKMKRGRTCLSLEEALDFIKFRAVRPNLYNNFHLQIKE